MMPIETVAIFLVASVALAFAPGPDNIFVLTQSALHGRKAGFVVTIGLCTGLLVHRSCFIRCGGHLSNICVGFHHIENCGRDVFALSRMARIQGGCHKNS